jgi:uncharacterized protein
MPDFKWDPAKEAINVRKHGFDFTTASQIWRGSVAERIDHRSDYGETRIIAVGQVDDSILVVVFTWRGETRRIISARKANSRERALFEEENARRDKAPPD